MFFGNVSSFFSAGFLYNTAQKMETKKVVLSGASEVNAVQ